MRKSLVIYCQQRTKKLIKMLISIYTRYTPDELTDLGRAMEREGSSSLQDFIANAVLEKVRSILSADK